MSGDTPTDDNEIAPQEPDRIPMTDEEMREAEAQMRQQMDMLHEQHRNAIPFNRDAVHVSFQRQIQQTLNELAAAESPTVATKTTAHLEYLTQAFDHWSQGERRLSGDN